MRTPLAVALCISAACTVLAQSPPPQPDFNKTEEKILPVQGNVYMIIGAGGNSTVQVGKDGVLIVDTQYAPMAPQLMAAIRTLSDQPIKYILNTHVHPRRRGRGRRGSDSLCAAK